MRNPGNNPALVILTALLIAVAVPTAELRAQTPDVQQKPLTDASVKGFAAAMVDLAEWSQAHNERWAAESEKWSGEDATPENAREMVSALSAVYGEAGEAVREAEKIVKRHGFSTIEEWTEVTSRVMQVYTAIELEKTQPAVDESVSSALDGLAASGISEAQKAEMKKALENARKQMEEFQSDIPPIDRKVVERNKELIDKAMEKLRMM